MNIRVNITYLGVFRYNLRHNKYLNVYLGVSMLFISRDKTSLVNNQAQEIKSCVYKNAWYKGICILDRICIYIYILLFLIHYTYHYISTCFSFNWSRGCLTSQHVFEFFSGPFEVVDLKWAKRVFPLCRKSRKKRTNITEMNGYPPEN